MQMLGGHVVPLTFQYQKGAIKTVASGPRRNLKPDFNTKKVRLKPGNLSAPSNQIYVNFNTKKVRLKPLRQTAPRKTPPAFQYQKGAIKTVFVASLLRRCSEFQYQKGAIKTC